MRVWGLGAGVERAWRLAVLGLELGGERGGREARVGLLMTYRGSGEGRVSRVVRGGGVTAEWGSFFAEVRGMYRERGRRRSSRSAR
jgi:hypothetical protein